MKALFVGAGSIGKRHMRDFYAECKAHELSPEIYVLRRKIGTIGEEDSIITKQITEIENCVFDVAFITNPTKLHFDALRKIGSNAKWFFIEKPIFDRCEYEIADLGISDSNLSISCSMQFWPSTPMCGFCLYKGCLHLPSLYPEMHQSCRPNDGRNRLHHRYDQSGTLLIRGDLLHNTLHTLW